MTTTDASTTRIDKSRNPEPPFDKLTIGVCPDQWGVWFPEDEKQIHWRTALAEMAEAGFSVMETGPWGYFPQDAKQLQSVMDEHGFRVVAGTGWGVLHKEEAWPQTEKTFRAIAETHAARSEEHTSELLSRGHLVCRLLLEKKKRLNQSLYYMKFIKEFNLLSNGYVMIFLFYSISLV